MKHIIRQRLRHKVIVTLKDGSSFAGVLYTADSEAVALRNSEALGLGEKGTNLAVDGEVVILRADISFIQLPG